MMSTHDRLIGCFRGVFPELSNEAILTASVDTVPRWDSLNNFMLVMVIEDEFQFQIPPDDLDDLTAFAAVESYLSSKVDG